MNEKDVRNRHVISARGRQKTKFEFQTGFRPLVSLSIPGTRAGGLAGGRSDELAVGRTHPLIDGEVYSCRAIYKTRCLHTVRIRYVKSMLVGDK